MPASAAVVFDKQASSRQAMEQALAAHGIEVVGTASPDEDLSKLARVAATAVGVVAVHERSDVELARSIRRQLPAMRILAVTSTATEVLSALRSSPVTAIIAQDRPPGEVAQVIEAVARGPARRIGAEPGSRRIAHLTPREEEMIQLLTGGLTAPAIAERLHLSRRTVEFHLGRAYRKLGVNGRIQAITAYERLRNTVPS